MPTPLTNGQYRNNLKNNNWCCPFCQSKMVDCESNDQFDIGGDTIQQSCWCNTCNKQWVDVYQFSHYGITQ